MNNEEEVRYEHFERVIAHGRDEIDESKQAAREGWEDLGDAPEDAEARTEDRRHRPAEYSFVH